MLIPFASIVRKYQMNITGIIHVGGHYGEEDIDYRKHGIATRHYFEADSSSFETLVKNTPGAVCHLAAIGAQEGVADFYKETFNTGQSNSLLKPGTHLDHYPLIRFNEVEQVQVKTLDSYQIQNCNFMNLDVQGYELEVLKGATNTLQNVQYVYTEVNTEDVYQGCGKMDEIDRYLKDFTRVETVMTGQGWGDALYVRNKSRMVDVPEEYRPHHPHQYPSDNKLIFEEWFYTKSHPVTERVYLPVFWTSFYCKYNYGANRQALKSLERYVQRLDISTKYYTVLQYDDGILNNVSHLDLKVFAPCGNRIDYPLPLLCKPHEYKFPHVKKDIECSYIGTNNHELRRHLMQYQNKTDWYISDRPHTLQHYCEILARSKYVLCPRGYGVTSFRIMEALQYGAIPVYISDTHVLPHHTFDYGITTRTPDGIPDILTEPVMPPNEAYERYFTYEANLKIIHENL